MDLKLSILNLLESPIVAGINFTVPSDFRPITVSGEVYRRVAQCIKRGHIMVRNWSNPGAAQYRRHLVPRILDVFPVSTFPLPAHQNSLILHECTHALCDWNSASVRGIDDEIAAYAAQVWYATSFGIYGPDTGIPALDDIFNEFFSIVNQLRNDGGWSTQGLARLRQKIPRLPTIRGIQYGAQVGEIRGYHGIPVY
jgi:hypothetical protein